MDKNNWSLIKGIPRNVSSAVSPDAKWGATSVGLSFLFFFTPMSFAFWAIQVSLDGGKIMLPTSIGAWIFFILAMACFVFAVVVGVFTVRMAWRWYAKSGEVKSTTQELLELQNHIDNHIDTKIGELSENIMALVSEIRRERNERSNKPKQ